MFGLFTAYVFYALWHSEELNTLPEPRKVKEKIIEDISNKKVISKTNYIPQETMPILPPKNAEKPNNVLFQTAKKLEEKTQKVYESLMPANHQELMEEGNIAFERLNEAVSNMEDSILNVEEQEEIESITEDESIE